MKRYIILIISLLIDLLISNITYYNFNNLTFLTPLCMVTSLIFIFDGKKDIKLLVITIILHSALFTNNLLLSFIIFIILYYLIKLMKYIIKDNLWVNLIEVIIVILVYELLLYFIYSSFIYLFFNINNYWYKVSHSLIINIIYAIIIYYVVKTNKKDHKSFF